MELKKMIPTVINSKFGSGKGEGIADFIVKLLVMKISYKAIITALSLIHI